MKAWQFHSVFKEINTLVSEGEINIRREKIELELFLGGDKVIKANSIIFYFMIYKICFFSSCCQYLA